MLIAHRRGLDTVSPWVNDARMMELAALAYLADRLEADEHPLANLQRGSGATLTRSPALPTRRTYGLATSAFQISTGCCRASIGELAEVVCERARFAAQYRAQD
jgi:hypothetical protein